MLNESLLSPAVHLNLNIRGMRQSAAIDINDQSNAEVTQPKGGFYVFSSFEPLRDRLAARGIVDGTTFCEHLLEDTGVACLPGHCFGRPDTEFSARVACVDFDGATALAAAARTTTIDEAFLRSHCAPVMAAIDRMCDWVAL